jgi:hypothetical protein
VGDTVYADDGPLGTVDGVIDADAVQPSFVVVSARRRLTRRYPVVPWSMVRSVDPSRRRVYLRGGRASLVRLSEAVPIVH